MHLRPRQIWLTSTTTPWQITTSSSTNGKPYSASTLTCLFEGEMEHRDSIGSVQVISPGDVGFMTSGSYKEFPQVPGDTTYIPFPK